MTRRYGGSVLVSARSQTRIRGLMAPNPYPEMDPPALGVVDRLRIHSVCPSVETRDGMVSSGMEEGMSEGYQRLDVILAGD